MKTVFTSREIAHIWANESAPHGRSPSSMRFDGDKFYSYATVIANRVRRKRVVAYVVDGSSFSSSTSNHQGRVRNAIRTAEKVFRVQCGRRGHSLEFTPQTLRDYYMDEFKRLMELPKSRYKHKQAEALLHAASQLKSASEVCDHFKIGGCAKIERILMKLDSELEVAHRLVNDRYQKRNSTRLEAERKAREEADARDAENIPKWLAGESVRLSYNCSPLMRVEGDEVVTSRVHESQLNTPAGRFCSAWPCGRRDGSAMATPITLAITRSSESTQRKLWSVAITSNGRSWSASVN